MSPSAPPTHPWLSSGQRRLAALAVAGLSALVLVGIVVLMVWSLRLFLTVFGHVIWPLAIAGILALLLRPSVSWLESKLKLPRVRAIVLLYFLVVATCLALGLLLLPLLISQMIELTHTLPEFAKNAFLHLKEKLHAYPDIYQGLKNYLDENSLRQQIAAASEKVTALLLSAPTTVRKAFELSAAVAVIPVYLFFLLETKRNFSRDMRDQLTFLPAALRQDVMFLIGEFADIMVSFFHGRLLIGLIMGVMMAVGFLAIGLPGGFVLGLFFGMLNLVPFLGAILGLGVVLPIAFFQTGGGWTTLGEAAAIFAVVQMAEAYYLMPKIMGHHTGLHPMVIIFSIFFWGAALHGILGMILAVPLTAFLVVTWRLLKSKYLPRHGVASERIESRSS